MPRHVMCHEITERLRDPGHAYIVAREVLPGEGAVASPYFEVSISGPHANERQDVHRHGRPVLEVYVPISGGIRYSYRPCREPGSRWRAGRCPAGEAVVFKWSEAHYVQYDGPCVVVKAPHRGERVNKQEYSGEAEAAAKATCPSP